MKISTLFYTIRQGFRNIFRNKWFSLASIATISACLFLFGIFYSIVMNFQHMVKNAQEGMAVTVFFNEDTSDERIQEIGELIAKRVEVSRLEFVTDDQAWEDFKEMNDFGEYAEGYPENPLDKMDNYHIYLSDVEMQDSLVTYLESIPEVRRINHFDSLAAMLSGANLLIGYVSLGIIVILLAVSIFLIRNTITIGITVRREEINIMKYIGATDFFVRAPFVLEGMLIGLIGAAVPLGVTYSIYQYAMEYVVDKFSILKQLLDFLPAETIFHVLTPVSLCVGVGIGFFCSLTTVRKHLHV